MPFGVELNRLASLWAEQPTSTCFAALAEALRKRGALEDARSVAAAGVAARPEYLPGRIVMARVYCDLQQWDAAQAELQAALALDPGHPVALDARDAIGHELATTLADDFASDEPAAETADEDAGDMVYVDDDSVAAPMADPVLTESLANLYRGQGHLVQALDVLDALVARKPGNPELTARRDAMRAELEVVRPRPYDASRSGGLPVRRWLSSLATAPAQNALPESSFDAFYHTPAMPASEDGDLAAFQAWLRELDR